MKERDKKKSFGKWSWNFSFDEGKKQKSSKMVFQLTMKKKKTMEAL